jgi:serine/threonine-protein kinase
MKYVLFSTLGQGGMATAHLVEDLKFHTEVAVKVLNKDFFHNENIRKRFIEEARKMFKISHPNIIKVTYLIE